MGLSGGFKEGDVGLLYIHRLALDLVIVIQNLEGRGTKFPIILLVLLNFGTYGLVENGTIPLDFP